MPDYEMMVPLGPWTPEAGEHSNPGLLAARGWNPWPTGGWRPYAYFTLPQVNLGGQVFGGHYHVWGDVWECYVVRDNAGNADVTRVTLQAGDPPTTLAIGAALDVSGPSWAAVSLKDHGYVFVSNGQHVLLAGDETVQMQARDSTTGVAFADMIPAGSVDRPSARYMANAGLRNVHAYILHNDATSQANYESDALLDENLIIFSGLKSGFGYFSTRNTADGGSNDFDEEEQANFYKLVDRLGVITGIATSVHGFGWVWKENGLYRFDYQQVPAEFSLIDDQHGTRSPRSIVVVDDMAYFFDQLGHFCRVGHTGPVEDLSSVSAMSVLLDDDAVFLGRYAFADLTQGTQELGGTSSQDFLASVDVPTILGGTGVNRYPCGYYDAHSGTVRWIYPGTHDRMTGIASMTSGQPTMTWVSGTTFHVAGGPFMVNRTLNFNDGEVVGTVVSVEDEDSLTLSVNAPGNRTAKTWYILFQRYLELVFQPANETMSVTDVTHRQDGDDQLPMGMHWGISAPNFGARLAQPADPTLGQRISYAPRDVLFAYIMSSTGTPVVDNFSLTYATPHGVTSSGFVGQHLLDDPTFLTSFDIAYPSELGVSSGALSTVQGLRIIFTPRPRRASEPDDLLVFITIRSKVRPGTQRDSAGALQGPLESVEKQLDFERTTTPTDARGWWYIESKNGNWHQLVVKVTGNVNVISSVDHLEILLRAVGMG